MDFKFEDAPETACFVCNHVFAKERPTLYVTHDQEDGFWSFLCGHDDHPNDEDYKIISLKQATAIDERINELYEMPLGIGAERQTAAADWEAFKLP